MHFRKCLLFNDRDIWVKKKANCFDMTMGGLNNTEICKLLKLYILHTPSNFEVIGGPWAKTVAKEVIDLFQRSAAKPI